MRRIGPTLAATISGLLLALGIMGAAAAQEIPSFPVSYSGNVTLQGQQAPEGLTLVACVQDCAAGWESVPVKTRSDGSYFRLLVAPGSKLVKKTITFWIVNESGRIRATETAVYDPNPNRLRVTLALDFTDPVPTPVPPTPTPTLTPTPAPTITPTPTRTPVPPIPGDPTVPRLSRVALIAGVAAMAAGGMILFVLRRRRAF